MSQIRLADISGMSQSQISNYELDRSEPGLDNLHRLAAAFGMSIAALIGDETPQYAPPRAPTPEEMAARIFDALGLKGERGELIKLLLENDGLNFAFYLGAVKTSLARGTAPVPDADHG